MLLFLEICDLSCSWQSTFAIRWEIIDLSFGSMYKNISGVQVWVVIVEVNVTLVNLYTINVLRKQWEQYFYP
ncbi:hypothetical protein L211DRAFT_228838 [Terfezia boudieri ATCC MYA-4762]|uniref:Uncharacterized protein n=1 Tax=Terfezia boudieri ATCC MYA-4762 TaxID=1051890 RepID=A0A3N4M0P1_9PEZI|nr:hypothetical protein L211DRAFT_228838 [Terfezia boudieri ATCC MYA-4762]